ncbi:MAG: hypothetical protein JSV33_00645 [bacterium]|nr:MAG: hypothetical protein JSV33_00645 [bacterium]
MKTALVFLIILILVLPACFDDGPTGPSTKNDDDDDKSPYSGAFMITDTLVSNDCVIPVPPGTVVNVTVVGDSINFAGFPGDWDSLTATGTGTSPETTIPVDPPDCYSYQTITFSIRFTDTNHFYGMFGADIRKDPGCPNPDPCSFTYRIGGSRN